MPDILGFGNTEDDCMEVKMRGGGRGIKGRSDERRRQQHQDGRSGCGREGG